ncbi:recombinase family protein [Pseudohalocynthiibacter aestuariivivens]|nr:recombinase family protein [Pseudohalocynthiibacter aestuariivivens]QIE45186.1 recombinase family protein [Pseudohalocynthiibacter aestuariivivens]
MRRVRCAIYTRKSTEEGLEQEFNSLDAQREACEAFIASQRHEGWQLLDRSYDDGGISGGHMDRPALQRLMQDVDDRQVDQIVVYKIDRLTRSLADFAKLVDRLDAAEASFVSVTQNFNTSSSMGRLTLNVLLSFAQFEREVTAERIRDKIAASKRKGLWMGGSVPLGYDADGRTLKINEDEATSIRALYDLYETHGALNAVTAEAAKLGIRSRQKSTQDGARRGGNILSRGHVHYILKSPIYAGRIPHKGKVFEGQHPAIVDPECWESVQQRLANKAPVEAVCETRLTQSSPLTGKLFDERGERLSPSHTRKCNRRYRYYISRGYVTGRKNDLQAKGWRLPAETFERFVADAIRTHLSCGPGKDLILDPDVETVRLLNELTKGDDATLLSTLSRARIGERTIELCLGSNELARICHTKQANIDEQVLSFDVPFIQKRRGVETRFIMSDVSSNPDPALIGNVARAHRWIDRLKAGEDFDEIATSASTTRKRVQQTIEFAFLAPDIVRDIIAGKQPIGLTSTWCMTHEVPAEWQAQRALIASL